MLAAVFLMSMHSAFFGPTKYGMLPELLPEKKLSWGNGIFGLGTFSATIVGTDFRRHAFGHVRQKPGLVRRHSHRAGARRLVPVPRRHARCPPRTRAKNSARIFSAISSSQLRAVRRDRALFLAVIGNTFLCFLALLLQLT